MMTSKQNVARAVFYLCVAISVIALAGILVVGIMQDPWGTIAILVGVAFVVAFVWSAANV